MAARTAAQQGTSQRALCTDDFSKHIMTEDEEMGALVRELKSARVEAAEQKRKKQGAHDDAPGWIDGLIGGLNDFISGMSSTPRTRTTRAVQIHSPEKPTGPLELRDFKKGAHAKVTTLEMLIAKGERALAKMEPEQRTGPEGTTMMHDLAVLLHEDGDAEQAAALLDQALAQRRSLFGEKHAATLETLHALASIHLDRDELTSAHTHFVAAAEGRREVLGASHPDTLSSMSGLGAVHQAQGSLDEAARIHSQVLDGRRNLLKATEAAAANDEAIKGEKASDETRTAAIAFLEAATSLAAVKLSLGELDGASTTLAEAMPAARQLGGSQGAIAGYVKQVQRCKALRAAQKAKDGGLLGDILAFSKPSGNGPKLSHRGEGPRKVLGRVAANPHAEGTKA